MKTCSKCGRAKDLSEYGIRKRRKDGEVLAWANSRCKECMKEINCTYQQEFRKNHREKHNEYARKSYYNNINRIKNYQKNRIQEHRESVRKYRCNNKEKLLIKGREVDTKGRLSLSKRYVIKIITQKANRYGTQLTANQVPIQLIEIQKKTIQFKREIKNKLK